MLVITTSFLGQSSQNGILCTFKLAFAHRSSICDHHRIFSVVFYSFSPLIIVWLMYWSPDSDELLSAASSLTMDTRTKVMRSPRLNLYGPDHVAFRLLCPYWYKITDWLPSRIIPTQIDLLPCISYWYKWLSPRSAPSIAFNSAIE